MIDKEWLIKLREDVRTKNPDVLLKEYVKEMKDELLNYTVTCKANHILYRGRLGFKRMFVKDEKYIYPYYGDEIKNPPSHLSESRRFNRDGFSYLYLSSDVETCIAELRVKVGAICSVAEFKQKRNLKLLDLDNNKIFKDFLLIPVCDDNLYHYNYTRFISDLIKALGIDGIEYDSVQSSGKCYVIFDPQSFELIEYSERMYLAKHVKYDYQEVISDIVDANSVDKEIKYMKNNPYYRR